MSRSNNTEITNPSTRFMEWDGTNGGFKYWDKEKEQNIKVDLPLTFMVLDCLATVGGFSDDDQSGYWSNQVRKIREEKLTVRTSKGTKIEGFYSEIKNDPSVTGMKFAQSVYIAFKNGDELVIGHIKFLGAALSSWIDFRKKVKNIYSGAVNVSGFTKEKKGTTEYTVPTFEIKEVSEETDQKSIELDKVLQEYLENYLSVKGKTVKINTDGTTEEVEDKPTSIMPDDDLPF